MKEKKRPISTPFKQTDDAIDLHSRHSNQTEREKKWKKMHVSHTSSKVQSHVADCVAVTICTV